MNAPIQWANGCAVVSNEESALTVIEVAKNNGMHLAPMSNIGLPAGHLRLTFLPASVFEAPPPAPQSPEQ